MSTPLKYTIDDLFDASLPEAFDTPEFDASTPGFQNTFNDGVAPSTLTAGELQGNLTVKDGYLQSSNYVAATTGWRLTPTSGDLNFPLSVDSIDIPDTVTASSFHVNSGGDAWWGATAIGSAVAKILATGVATFTSINLSGAVTISGIANNSSTDIALLEKTHDLVFSVTDLDTIAWASGTVTLSNGRTFSISAGNTGNMAALTYIYIDPAVSSTVLQTTTTAATGMGANKILLGVAQNHAVSASFIPYGPGQPLIDGSNIGALSIVAGNIAASTITAGKLSVSQLSAIAADFGTITTGVVNLSSGTANIHAGQTAYDTGTGFWLEYNAGTPRFSIGNSSASKVTWDGTTLSVVGTENVSKIFTAAEAISSGDAVSISDGVNSVLDIVSSAQSNSFGVSTAADPNGQKNAQSFSLSRNATITKLVIDLAISAGSPGDSVVIAIQTDSAGSPSGSDISSSTATKTSASLSSSLTSYTLSFSGGIALTGSTTYWLILRRSGALDDANYYKTTVNAAGSSYAGGSTKYYNGASWSTPAGATDMNLQLIETVTAGQVVQASSIKSNSRQQNFIGFANAAISSAASGAVSISGAATLSGLTAGLQYYLSDTKGAVSSSAGTTTRKVGISLSTTQMQITNLW